MWFHSSGALTSHILKVLYVCGSDGVPRTMPYAEYADMPLPFLDIKNDEVNSPALAVEQMAGGETKLVGFRYQRAAGRNLAEAVNGHEQTHQPFFRVQCAASRMR